MEAEKKLQGVMYHLQRMEEMYLKNEENFVYELEAFLVKIRSVPDVLLEDFNEKFSLGISLEEELYPKTFEERARQQQNIQAIDFIQWWKTKMEMLKFHPLGSIFFGKKGKRNISVHRKVVAPDLKKITLFETIQVTATVRNYDEKGNFIEERKSPETPPEPVEPKPPIVEWAFKDYPNEDVIETCKKLFKIVKDFIEEAKGQFS